MKFETPNGGPGARSHQFACQLLNDRPSQTTHSAFTRNMSVLPGECVCGGTPCRCGEVVRTQILVQGLCCANEAALIHKLLDGVLGIKTVSVSVLSRRAVVRHDPLIVPVEEIVGRLNKAKLGAAVQESGAAVDSERFTLPPGELALLAVLAVTYVIAVFGFALGQGDAWARWLALGVAVVGSWPLCVGASTALCRRRSVDMNVLMLISVGGAVGYGVYADGSSDAGRAWLDAALVVVLFGASEQMAAFASLSVRNALSEALSTVPPRATLASSNKPISLDEVVPGMILAVRTGDRVPVDGTVRKGAAHLDESAVTGESKPMAKVPGDGVIGGTVVTDGYMEVEATTRADESTAARIAGAVADAQASRSPTAQLVDAFARWYTPGVLVASVVLLLYLLRVQGAPLRESLMRSLTLVVSACPCALVMATPVAVSCTVTAVARGGVLVKNGASVEALAGLRSICMDKTGTLTAGKFRVVERRSFGENQIRDGGEHVLRLAAAVEAKSRHPLASAIVEASVGCVASAIEEAGGALGAGLPDIERGSMKTLAGVGVRAVVEGHVVSVGSHRLLKHERDVGAANPVLAEWDMNAHTPVVVTVDGRLALMLALADTPRPTAFAAVNKLQEGLGVDVAMLTGDRAAPAFAASRALGLRGGTFSELLPDQKLGRIKSLVESHGMVGMVGDGINDTPALAAASVGIAMGSGLALAADSADVVLLTDDLSRIAGAIHAARRCRGVVWANIAIAAGLKLSMAILVLVWSDAQLWMAVLADVGALVGVILNGCRLLRDDGVGAGEAGNGSQCQIAPKSESSESTPLLANGVKKRGASWTPANGYGSLSVESKAASAERSMTAKIEATSLPMKHCGASWRPVDGYGALATVV